MAALFPLGWVAATPGAIQVLDDAGTDALELLRRHAVGDWGEVSACDARENDISVRNGWRVLSSYPISSEAGGEKIRIITEADHSSTCPLLPNEY